MRLIRSVGKWVDQRLQLGAPMRETMDHPIPRDTASWFYVFDSVATKVLAFQLVTGILLALDYEDGTPGLSASIKGEKKPCA